MTTSPPFPGGLTRTFSGDTIHQLKTTAKTPGKIMRFPSIASYRQSARSKKLKDDAAFTFYRASLPPTALSPYPNYAALLHHQPQLALWCRDRAIHEYTSDWEQKESPDDRRLRLREDLREFMMRKKQQDEESRQQEMIFDQEVMRREAWVKKEMERRGSMRKVVFWSRENLCRGNKCCCLL